MQGGRDTILIRFLLHPPPSLALASPRPALLLLIQLQIQIQIQIQIQTQIQMQIQISDFCCTRLPCFTSPSAAAASELHHYLHIDQLPMQGGLLLLLRSTAAATTKSCCFERNANGCFRSETEREKDCGLLSSAQQGQVDPCQPGG